MTQQTEKNDEKLVEVRCINIRHDIKSGRYFPCNRLLAKVSPDAGYCIVCTKCGYVNKKEKANG